MYTSPKKAFMNMSVRVPCDVSCRVFGAEQVSSKTSTNAGHVRNFSHDGNRSVAESGEVYFMEQCVVWMMYSKE